MKKTLLIFTFIFSAILGFAQSQKNPNPLVNQISLKPSGLQGKDSDVFSNGPNNNYANSAILNVYTWTNSGILGIKRSFIEFNIPRLLYSSPIDSAYLELYYDPLNTINFQTHTGNNIMEIERVTSPWTENVITWNNQPTTTDSSKVIVPSFSSNTQNYKIDVTVLLNKMLSTNNYGFMIKMQDEMNYYLSTIFASSDNADSTLHPELTIYYQNSTSLETNDVDLSEQLIVFPNPSHGIVNFGFKNDQKLSNFDIQIINILGQSQTVQASGSQVDISSFSKGMYFVKLTNNSNQTYLKKITIF